MLNRSSFISASLCSMVICALAGCGGSADLAPTSGVVTLGGKPVADARVMFHPTGGGRTSYATTNEAGEFKASTVGTYDGAVVGSSVVTITKVDTSGQVKVTGSEGYMGKSYEQMMSPAAIAKMSKPKMTLPQKYSSKDTSGIQVDVVKGQSNKFTFDLEEGGKK